MIEAEVPTKGKNYYFSDYGRLKSVTKLTGDESLLKGSKTIQGYHQINITFVGDVRRGYYVHKLIAETWVKKNNADQMFVIHIDGNKSNNHYNNLTWMTQAEMTKSQIDKGVYNPQNRKPSYLNRMNPSRVKLLKKRLKEGKTKKKILAKNFNISVEQLRKIEKGIDWGYVKLDGED